MQRAITAIFAAIIFTGSSACSASDPYAPRSVQYFQEHPSVARLVDAGCKGGTPSGLPGSNDIIECGNAERVVKQLRLLAQQQQPKQTPAK